MIRRAIMVMIILPMITLLASAQVFMPPLTSYQVWTENKTDQPLKVTVKWYWPVTSLDYADPDFMSKFMNPENANSIDPFQTIVYLVPSGKRVFLGTTTGRTIYFKAHTFDERHVWQGAPNGGFIEVDMGPDYTRFTQRFFMR